MDYASAENVAYDIQDVVDEFILSFGYNHGHGFYGHARKIFTSTMNYKLGIELLVRYKELSPESQIFLKVSRDTNLNKVALTASQLLWL